MSGKMDEESIKLRQKCFFLKKKERISSSLNQITDHDLFPDFPEFLSLFPSQVQKEKNKTRKNKKQPSQLKVCLDPIGGRFCNVFGFNIMNYSSTNSVPTSIQPTLLSRPTGHNNPLPEARPGKKSSSPSI